LATSDPPRSTPSSETAFVEDKKTETPLDSADAITGTVTMGDNRHAVVRSDAKSHANLQDKTEFFIKSSGSNALKRIASGRVFAIDDYGSSFDTLTIDIDHANGEAAPGQFVRIISKNPRKSSIE
jgi:hypothetical protein